MNVKELKELIKDLPDKMPVVVDGYERGIKSVEKTGVIDIYEYKNNTTLYGEFIGKDDQFFQLEDESGNLTHIGKAFYLSREYLDECKYDKDKDTNILELEPFDGLHDFNPLYDFNPKKKVVENSK